MLKHRLIFGLLFSALFFALIALDAFASRNWPDRAAWATPPGFFVALVSVIVIPLGIIEMRGLLQKENVRISLRITIAAAILCMLWPWIEQVSESIMDAHAAARINTVLRANPDSPDVATDAARLHQIESSPWYALGRRFYSVKPHYLVPTILAFSLVAAFVMHSRNQRVDGAIANAGGTLLAIVYLGVLTGFFLPICMTHSAWMVLAIVGIVKAADVGAYTTGRLLGRHKLIVWLSPGKTVEGFFGGLILAGLVSVAIAAAFHQNGGPRWEAFPWPVIIIGGFLAGIILGAVGQLGDLLESLLKRDAGVKDSGALPGFGGVLDILDSPLLAAPVAYWMLKIILPPVSAAIWGGNAAGTGGGG